MRYLKKQYFQKRRFLFMKYCLLAAFCISLAGLAQVPQPGIYRLSGVEIYRNPYEYNYAEKKWLKPRHWPVISQYNVRYAMVAVDSMLKVKVVLIPEINPGDAYAPLRLLSGFSNRTDSLANVYYSSLANQEAGFEQRPVRYWSAAFRIAENQLVKKDTQLVNGKPKPVFTLRHTGSRFELAQPRPYSAMLCMEPVRVALHSKPDASETVNQYLQQGQCVAVIGDEDAWMQVEWISPEGKISQGWILKMDLQIKVWVPQKQQTPDYRFELGWRDTTQTDSYADAPTALAIKIVSLKNEKPPQIIERPLAEPFQYGTNAPDDALQVHDCNFDGYPDLEIFAHSGGAGPNYGNDYYLYNPKKQAFEYSEELSVLTQPEIHTAQKRIYTSWRNGAGNHGSEVYTFADGKLETEQRWERNCILPSLFCVWYEGKNVAGQWIETEKRSAFLGSYGNNPAVPVPVFAQPEAKQAIDTILTSEVVVQEENACWMRVEYDAIPMDTATQIKQGWIRKDVFTNHWKPITQTQRFRLEVAPETETTAGWNGIRIIERKTNQVYQVILPDFSLFPSDSLIHTGDYNFDGQPDFRIESNSSEAVIMRQQLFEYYIFNTQSGYFERDSLLSDSPNVSFDKATKTFANQWFTQAGDEYLYHKKQYRVIKKQWECTETWEGKCRNETFLITHRKLQHGQWVEKAEEVPLKTILPVLN
jgi:hypothetical protein